MNFELIGTLVRLRYKLLWANTRTRNGKIALFFAGYLLLIMFGALLAAGGLGAGLTAIRSGKGTLIAGLLLTGIFVQALLASAILGFGMTVIFSEGELRRYPLSATERTLTRHLIGVADPFWILFLLLDLGLAFGLYLFGAGGFWYGLLAVLMLFACNYIAARVVVMLIDRLTSRKFGSMILLGSVMCLGLLPSILMPVFEKHKEWGKVVSQLWKATPPAMAGVAMTHLDLYALQSLGGIALWSAALVALLIAIEHMPRKKAKVQAAAIAWEDRMDRLASIYGPQYGPLVAHWLRFYWRNNRFRMIYPLALPLSAFLMFFFGRQSKMGGPFSSAISAFAILGFIGTGQFAVNQFGYVGGGFRRFLLLPTDPAAAFRAGSFMFVTLGSLLIPPALIAWVLFGPIPATLPMVIMFAGASLTTLFLFHGIALYTSLFGARRGRYQMALGNDLSFAGNVVVIGGMMTLLFGPRVLDKLRPGWVTPDYWFVTVGLAGAAAAFYFVSLRVTSGLFRGKREELMALMEGKG